MPIKPKRPCSYPGCPILTEGRYCEEHKKKVNRDYERYGRDKETRKRYGRGWQIIRDRYIHDHPLCEICEEEGRLVRAEHVHHIKPFTEGGSNEDENLMALCLHCNSKIHAERGDRWNKKTGRR